MYLSEFRRQDGCFPQRSFPYPGNSSSLCYLRIFAKAIVCFPRTILSGRVSFFLAPIVCISLLVSESHCLFVAYIYCHVLCVFPLVAYQAYYTKLLCTT